MTSPRHISLFAFDCGATNWRIVRAGYQESGFETRLVGEPQLAPLTSFINRRLAAVLLLNPEGTDLESFGEVAQGALDEEKLRERMRDYFKPCIGAHLEENPLPHQKRYTHSEALTYTHMLLGRVLDQLRREKLRDAPFGESTHLAFAYPVHWKHAHGGEIFDNFKAEILGCLPPEAHDQVHFIAEPEAAILSLERQGLLSGGGNGVTLIVDVGGSTTDIVAGRLAADGKGLRFMGRYGQAHGGGLFDAEIAKYIADELSIPASALADDPHALLSLRDSARRLKESLSRQLLEPGTSMHTPQRTVTVVMRGGGIFRHAVRLDEKTFLRITRRLNDEFKYLIDNALGHMRLGEEHVGQVVLVGGGAQLFTVMRHLRERFGGDKIILADNPDEIVVLGAALALERSRDPEPAAAVTFTPEPSDDRGTILFSPWDLQLPSGERSHLPYGTTTLGRSKNNDICLPDDLISRAHARIQVEAQGVEITDLGSANGTFLNGVRLTPDQPYPLQNGDELKLGSSMLGCRGPAIETSARKR